MSKYDIYVPTSCHKCYGSLTQMNQNTCMHDVRTRCQYKCIYTMCSPNTCAPRFAHQWLNSEFWGACIALYVCMVEFGLTYIICIKNNGFRPWYPVKTTTFWVSMHFGSNHTTHGCLVSYVVDSFSTSLTLRTTIRIATALHNFYFARTRFSHYATWTQASLLK